MAKKKTEVTEAVEAEVVEAEVTEVEEPVKEEPEAIKAKKSKPVKEEDDRVRMFIPFIEGEDPEVTVGINGHFTKIKKGEEVYVSPAVAQVIANSNAQTKAALENQKKFKEQVQEW